METSVFKNPPARKLDLRHRIPPVNPFQREMGSDPDSAGELLLWEQNRLSKHTIL